MLNKSYTVIVTGLVSMIIASVMLYFKTFAVLSYVMLGGGFLGIGIGILLGFAKMVSEDKN